MDWAFPAWIIYVEYATRRIAEAFPLAEEERRQLLDFRDTMKRLPLETRRQAREKLTSIYKAIVGGMYRIEGNRLYAPDGMWIYIDKTIRIPIHGVNVMAHFPDILKLPQGARATPAGLKGER